jgi:hypothetical protein
MAGQAAHADAFDVGAIDASLQRYIGFGVKHAGGAGDDACGAWLEGELRSIGYAVQRQAFETPFLDVASCALALGQASAPLLPVAVVSKPGAISGPLALYRPGADMSGAIVVAPLPFRRWSTTLSPEISNVIEDAERGGAAAVVLVTNGPTNEAIALNVKPDQRWPLQVATLAPKEAADVLAAAEKRTAATLTLTGRGGMRPAFNVVARRDRGRGKQIVFSTPRSGWTICAGERGGGVAAWLALATWAFAALPENDLVFLCTSAHEYEYLGGETYLKSPLAPKAADTHLWAHLGANVAARDWHDFGPGRLAPLPSVDPQRVLMGTPDLLPVLRETFRGAPGLESPYPSNQGAAGELASVLHAGYGRAFGIFGAHRFHHVAGDDARCVEARHVADAAVRMREAIRTLAR